MPKIDPKELRKALGCFLTGVTIVTAREPDGTPRGFTANSFTSVSLDPPLVLVCLAKSASSFGVFEQTPSFAINMLSEHQRDISNLFASKKIVDKFDGVQLQGSDGRSPILDGVVAWIDCTTHKQIDAGDHLILIGEVQDFGYNELSPLGFYSGNYIEFGLGRQAVEVGVERQTSVCGIFEQNGRVLLMRNGSRWELPTGHSLGERNPEPGSLFASLNKAGVDASVTFVFSIAQDERTGEAWIIYRGEITSPLPASDSLRLVAFDEIPWTELREKPPYEELLSRYFKERAEARFGVYVGSTSTGRVRSLNESH